MQPKEKLSLLRRLSRKIASPRDRIIFTLFLETGCTTDEIVALKAADFEPATCSLQVGAGAEKRRAKLPLELSLLINSFADRESEYLLATRQSSRPTNRRVMQIVAEQSLALAGQKLRPTDLRKLAIGNYLSRSRSPAKAREFAGLTRMRQREFLVEEQIESIRAGIGNEQHSAIFSIISETGCAASDVSALKPQDIDSDAGRITFRHEGTRKEFIAVISRKLSLQIKSYLEKKPMPAGDYLFSTRQSARISGKRVYQIVRKCAQANGFPRVSPRMLRNSLSETMRKLGKVPRGGARPGDETIITTVNLGRTRKRKVYIV